MSKRRLALCSALLVLAAGSLARPIAGAAPGSGLPRVDRVAARAVLEQAIAWAHVKIDYGRPETRGRRVFGEMVPYGRIWRLGADEATRLVTDADLELGSLAVPAGSYALFVVPQAGRWTLVVNKVADQWGAWNWNRAQDLGRVELDVETLAAPIEALTLELLSTGERSATLTIAWERSRVTVPINVVGDPPAPPATPVGAGKVDR